MSIQRRRVIKGLLGAAVGLALTPWRAWAARPEKAFAAQSTSDALEALFGSGNLTETGKIEVKAPDIAENGAVVPVTVEFDVPGAETVSIFVDENPSPLAASFALTAASGGLVSTRIKMGKTSMVHAVIKAGDKVLSASKEVKVTIGGCGG